jgi:uncharacterized protein YjbJ (UPF0337 family)
VAILFCRRSRTAIAAIDTYWALRAATRFKASTKARSYGMNKQQVKGVTNQVTGGIKREVGKLTGDRETQARGAATEIKGKVQKGVGDARDAVHQEDRAQRDLDFKR